MSTIVKTSTRLWSQEVAEARATEELDSAGPGEQGLARLLDEKEPGWEFSNGRKFKDVRGVYS